MLFCKLIKFMHVYFVLVLPPDSTLQNRVWHIIVCSNLCLMIFIEIILESLQLLQKENTISWAKKMRLSIAKTTQISGEK